MKPLFRTVSAAVFLAASSFAASGVTLAAEAGAAADMQSQSMGSQMRQLGDAVANSGMMQKAMNAVQAELTKCMKKVVSDGSVLNTVTGGDYRAAALAAMRACTDRVEAGEFTK